MFHPKSLISCNQWRNFHENFTSLKNIILYNSRLDPESLHYLNGFFLSVKRRILAIRCQQHNDTIWSTPESIAVEKEFGRSKILESNSHVLIIQNLQTPLESLLNPSSHTARITTILHVIGLGGELKNILYDKQHWIYRIDITNSSQ